MKKIKLLKTLLIPTIGITAIGTIAAVSTSCSSVVIVTGVSLNKNSLTLDEGDSDTLIATVLPEDATDKSVTWRSSDSSITTIDRNGNVTAVSEGQATITVTTNDGGFTDTCQVTVNQKIIHVIGVLLDKESLILVGAGSSETLIATVHPENATNKSVTWTSSNSSVATVDNNGKVYANSLGSAKITVKTNDGGYEDYCDVTVARTDASYICVTANADSTLELINDGGNNPNLQYSDDHKIWHDYSGAIRIPTDTNLYLRGNNSTGWSQGEQTFSHFKITGNVSISGNVMGLLDNGAGTISSIPNDYCFYGLFCNSTGITSVSEDFLPATELTKECYCNMFINCSSLTTAPNLPTTTLASNCYQGMFAHCASLTTVPDLPATTLADYCYYAMFMGCTSLKNIPNTLTATTLANSCYSNMFRGCASLTTVPNLPATTLAQGCYWSMFEQCISLTTAPELPATTLAPNCYQSMFHSCSSLTTAPVLPATTLTNSCYAHMFCKCTSLITAPDLPATTLAANCYQGMFAHCTSLTTAPAVLPATTLSIYCYHAMFYDCTSLTTAPDLAATQLAEWCYESLFEGCVHLTSIRIAYSGLKSTAPSDAFLDWVYNVSLLGTFYYKGSDSAWNFGFASGWTINPN